MDAPATQRSNSQEIQMAIAKATELRALHTALFQGNGTSSMVPRLSASTSPSLSRPSVQLSAEEYPVFTPSYGEKALPVKITGCWQEPQRLLENLSVMIRSPGKGKDEGQIIPIGKKSNRSPSSDGEHTCFLDDKLSHMSSSFMGSNVVRSARQSHSGDFFTSSTTCNRCQPATISREAFYDRTKPKNSTSNQTTVSSGHSIGHLHLKPKSPMFSWLFPRGNKKLKPEMSPSTMEPDKLSQLLKDWGVIPLESLKRELLDAREKKDAALAQVSGMKSSLGDLKKKLVSLESYCEELKRALKRATVQTKGTPLASERQSLSKQINPAGGGFKDISIPVSDEVMVEGFLQIVSEARVSVKQFCKTLIDHAKYKDNDLMEKLNILLQSHQIALSSSKYSKLALYHLEALLNQYLYQDFENCVFQRGGCSKFLDPHHGRNENFSAFMSLRNLARSEVAMKESKYYSEDLSRFCNRKMGIVLSTLKWSMPWPEHLLQSFLVSAKCIWMIHLLAFSFYPPLMILRVEENRNFDPLYMEDILNVNKRQAHPSLVVKIMMMPGFYVQDSVLRCRVLCN